MNVQALMNRLEDIGEDRPVVVRVLVPAHEDDAERGPQIVEFDVVGCEVDGLSEDDDGLAVLVLRERRDIAPEGANA